MATSAELNRRTEWVAQSLELAGPLYVVAIYPAYATTSGDPDRTYTPWFVGHCDETKLDEIESLAEQFVPQTDDAVMDEFTEFLRDRGYVILNSAAIHGTVTIGASWAE